MISSPTNWFTVPPWRSIDRDGASALIRPMIASTSSGIRRLVQRGVAGQVGEHHGRVAALAVVAVASAGAGAGARGRAPQPLQNRCAALQGGSASGAGRPQRGAAGAAKPGPGRVVGVAAGAGHGRSVPRRRRSIIAGSRRPGTTAYVRCATAAPGVRRAGPAACGYPRRRNTIVGFSALDLQGPGREAASAFSGAQSAPDRMR